MTLVTEKVAAIHRQIQQLEQQYGRSAGSVGVLAVSKRHSVDSIRQAGAVGLRDFGENYVQEAVDKIELLAGEDYCWHFIGPIQSNKTRAIAEHFDWVQSVDRAKIARRLSEQRPQHCRPLNICVQVNISNESGKSGVAAGAASQLCAEVAQLPGLTLRGLMAIPAVETDFQRQRHTFAELARLYQRLRQDHDSMDTLSMGMSGDFEAAIAEGATLIRLGTALFGPRD